MSPFCLILGIAIVLVTAVDIFQSVIVPRPTGRRLRGSVTIARRAWATWRFVADRLDPKSREAWLGTYAPLLLVGFLGFWVVSLVFGYGLIFYGLRAGVKPVPTFFEAMYFSSTTALTVGFGDYVPTSVAARIVSFFAGASGLAGLAVGTAFLFPIFGAYQSREVFVLLLGNRAGRPPSAVELLVHDGGASSTALSADLRDAELWFAQLLETHLAYPVLTWFRSTDERISWVAAAETILDATALLITAVKEPASDQAVLVQRIGLRFVTEFSRYVRLPDGDHSIDRAAFDRAYDRLASAGLIMYDRDSARQAFALMRRRYAPNIDSIARFWYVPRARPIGDIDERS